MNPQNPFAPDSVSGAQPSTLPGSVPDSVEVTLRLIASLPAPAGLEDRINAGLRARQHSQPHQARILAWPAALRPGGNWMHSAGLRAAAAAAIVMVVAGGGWSIYSRVQPRPAARAIVLPTRPAVSGGFASGGAMRTPQTLNGPVLTHPATAVQTPAKAAVRPGKKQRRTQPATDAGKAATQPVAPAAK
jgi:hypothetical protein